MPVSFPQTTENDGGMMDMVAADPVDGPRRNTVGHLYRQFSRRNKNKKNKQQRPESAAVQPALLPPPPSPPPGTREPARIATDTPDLLSRVRPALAGDVVHAPPWLVADHFVSEHVAHEHVSVVPEPDHADPVWDDKDEDAPPLPLSPPPRAASDAAVDCYVSAALSCEIVSIAR